jgi:uncharacterized protein (DUF885 family)
MPSERLAALADAVLAWRSEQEAEISVARGKGVTRLAPISRQEVDLYAMRAGALLSQLKAIESDGLSPADVELRTALLLDLSARAEAGRNYPYDLMVTPNRGSDLHLAAAAAFRSAPLDTSDQRGHYLLLLAKYGRAIDEVTARTIDQRRLGVLVPRPALPGVRAFLEALDASLGERLSIEPARLDAVPLEDRETFSRAVVQAQDARIRPALGRLRAVFDAGYERAAPAGVGLLQYRGGIDRYARCISAGTGLALTPSAIHDIGLEALQEIGARQALLRKELGAPSDAQAFADVIRTDPRFLASDPGDVERRYAAQTALIAPLVAPLFERMPAAGYGLKRLDPAYEPGMTYGIYQPPSAGEPRGLYRYNGTGLDRRTMVGAGHLMAHELIPGHHLQIGLSREGGGGHPVLAFLDASPFVEGWAEYAAQLAADQGAFSGYDLYGHLGMQAFLASRLVVDTGMNALGWSLDRARAFMRQHTLEAEPQIVSETLRYSTDIPCQALGYYLGYRTFQSGRSKAKAALGEAFDVRRFHTALLTGGAVPLNILNERVDRFIVDEKRRLADDGSPPQLSALSRAGVEIRARPDEVWSRLLDRSGWMPDTVEQRLLSGTAGQTGAVTLYRLRRGSTTAERLETVLASLPNERLVLALADPQTRLTFAYVDQRLESRAGGTSVTMEMYWHENPSAGLSAADRLALQSAYDRDTSVKMQSALARLKALMEAR